MKIIEKMKNSSAALKITALRFPASFLNILTMIFVMIAITVTDFDDDWIVYLLTTVIAGAFVSAALTLEFELRAIDSKIKKIVSIYVPLMLEIVWFALSFTEILDMQYYFMATLGISASAILYSLYCISCRGKKLCATASTLKSLCFSFFACLVIFLGGVICLGAFIVLIFDFNSSYKLFLILFEICIALGMCLLLAEIPKDIENSKTLSISKAYKAIILYTELPLYFVLTGVLYLYLIKLVFKLDFPSGGVNPYVTFASAAYIFNIFAAGVFKDTSKLAKFFMKYGGLLMLPLIVIQCVTLGIRLYYYGLTTQRFISVCFIAITLLFAIGSFVKHIGQGKPLVIASILVFVITCTPLNIIDVPVYQQTLTLKNVLYENGMLENGKILPAPESISDKDVGTIISCHNYITRNAVKLPDFLEDYRYISANSVYDLKQSGANTYHPITEEYCNYVNINFAEQSFDISEYSYITKVYCYEEYIINTERDGMSSYYDLLPVITYLTENYGMIYWKSANDKVITVDEKADFYYESVRFIYEPDTDTIKDVEIEGYLLEK